MVTPQWGLISLVTPVLSSAVLTVPLTNNAGERVCPTLDSTPGRCHSTRAETDSTPGSLLSPTEPPPAVLRTLAGRSSFQPERACRGQSRPPPPLCAPACRVGTPWLGVRSPVPLKVRPLTGQSERSAHVSQRLDSKPRTDKPAEQRLMPAGAADPRCLFSGRPGFSVTSSLPRTPGRGLLCSTEGLTSPART